MLLALELQAVERESGMQLLKPLISVICEARQYPTNTDLSVP